MADSELEDWAKSIEELRPDIDLEKLKLVIDKMKLGKADWNPRLGIQNIFAALDKEDKERDFLSRL